MHISDVLVGRPSVGTYSMVVFSEPAENSPSMKIPVGKLTLPLKDSVLNS